MRLIDGFDVVVSSFMSPGIEPPNTASFKPEVRLTTRSSPNRWSKRRGAVFVLCHAPAGPLIRQEIHMEDAFAAAGTEHGRLLEQAIVLHEVKSPFLQLFRQIIFDNPCCVRWDQPTVQPFIELSGRLPGPPFDAFHPVRLSASSRRPRSGSVSPMPTRSKRVWQGIPSCSVISSMLDRLNVVLA